jgi:hypothetical protein
MLDGSDTYVSALSVSTTRKIYNFYYGNIFRGHLEEPGVDGRIILRWIFRKLVGGGAWNGLIWLRIGTGGGHF